MNVIYVSKTSDDSGSLTHTHTKRAKHYRLSRSLPILIVCVALFSDVIQAAAATVKEMKRNPSLPQERAKWLLKEK